MADGLALELAPGIQVAWDDLDRARTDLAAEHPSAEWRLEGTLDAGHSALRVLTGGTGEGALILLAAARPDGADGHDADAVQAVLVSPSGEEKPIEEALVSTQYSASGRVERVGLELYSEGEEYPVRGAGDARRASASDDGPLRREHAWLDFRLDGEPGDAILDIVYA